MVSEEARKRIYELAEKLMQLEQAHRALINSVQVNDREIFETKAEMHRIIELNKTGVK